MTSRTTMLAWTLGAGLAALTLTASAARQGQGTVSSPVSSPEPVTTTSCASAIDTQNRINRYFHQAVVPRMAGCWSRIAGAGTVAMHLEYQRTGEEWTPGPSGIRSSTLPRGQDDAALDCLRKAVEGTSFAVEPTDGESQQFNVNWSFPVPWPRDLSEAALRMVSTGREPSAGECGGSEGPAPACFSMRVHSPPEPGALRPFLHRICRLHAAHTHQLPSLRNSMRHWIGLRQHRRDRGLR